AATGVEVLARPTDVTRPDEVRRLIAETLDRFGRIDICVTNAGGPPSKSFADTTIDDWSSAVNLNLMSTLFFAREVLPIMQKRGWGRLITITSISVKQPIDGLILSNSVRSAVSGLVKSLANEFGKDGILVNNVAPGYTATERLKELAGTRALAAGIPPEQIYGRWAADVPVGRLGQPEELAAAIVFLASERASYITGQTLLVDGGYYKGLF
ncbi:MAG TPA: SDR family oxidoreductase, partial [Terriglobales bacterium]|nr:SDR family oxidoreductase [Terriglobales bacterium]